MTTQKAEDVRDTALKLDEIRTQCPEDYFYLKGWIHCLSRNRGKVDQPHKPPVKTA